MLELMEKKVSVKLDEGRIADLDQLVALTGMTEEALILDAIDRRTRAALRPRLTARTSNTAMTGKYDEMPEGFGE